jgi:hypothetical protein
VNRRGGPATARDGARADRLRRALLRRVLGLRVDPAEQHDDRVIDSGSLVLATSAVLILVGVVLLGIAFRGVR